MTTKSIKKTAPRKDKKPPVAVKPQEVSDPTELVFGAPIDTEKIRVDFDIPNLTIRYTLKESKESVEKEYKKIQALMIIHGRMKRNPHGEYARMCIARARIDALKHGTLTSL